MLAIMHSKTPFRIRIVVLASLFAVLVALPVCDALAKRVANGQTVGQTPPRHTHPREAGRDSPAMPVASVAGPSFNATGSSVRHATGSPLDSGPASARSRWLAPMAGLAAGVGLSGLAASVGLAEELAGLVTLAVLLATLAAGYAFWRQRRRPVRQMMRLPTYAYGAVGQEAMVAQQYWLHRDADVQRPHAPVVRPPHGADSAAGFGHIPPQLNVTEFEREARALFQRMQSAYDNGRIEQLREFTGSEMFERIHGQIAGRELPRNPTEQLRLDVELLAHERRGEFEHASVRYIGQVREADAGGVVPFDEVWNLSRPADGLAAWTLVSVQPLTTY